MEGAEIGAGRWRGPLHGIPFAVKDNYDVAGVATTGASRLRLDHVATGTAAAVRRLQAAGAILLGKLNTWKYGTGTGAVHHDLPFPAARNPWNIGHFTGGSSSGAGAAAAAGIEAMADVLAGLGAEVAEAHLPAPLTQYEGVTSVINWSESYSIHERDFLERGAAMGQALRDKMMSGFTVRAADYLAAQRQRRSLALSTDANMRCFDAVILPCAMHVAPPFDDPEAVTDFTRHKATTPFNVSGHPGMSVCTGFTDAGLPTNAQIGGRYFDEATVLRVAYAYEAATAWQRRRPVLGGD